MIHSVSDASTRVMRRWFAASAFLATSALIYASIVPITPQVVSWADAVSAFWALPWLQLDVYRRADWVANALVVIPVGWLMAATIDWGRTSRWWLFLSLPWIIVGLCALVTGIEFLQAWFPPRTRSLNDVFAGCVGATIGPVLWLICGRFIVGAVLGIRHAVRSRQRVIWGLVIYAILNLGYSAMPLDLVLSRGEWEQKRELGRLIFWPSDWDAAMTRDSMVSWALAAIRSGIFAFFAARALGTARALLLGITFALACEAIQVPIFTGKASVFDAAAAIVGVVTGVVLALSWPRISWPLRYPVVWLAGAALSLAAVFIGTIVRTTGLVSDPLEIARRWDSFWAWPFAKHYYLSEFEAVSNVLSKLIVFAAVGFCLRSAAIRIRPTWRRPVVSAGVAAAMTVGALIEVSQVYMLPNIPDATDIVLYAAGLALGYAAQWFANPIEAEHSGVGRGKITGLSQ